MSFDDLIGTEGLSRDEEAKLRRVHELLVAAGPPPDLSPDLSLPPVPTEEADPPEVAFLLRRRRGRVLVLALAADARRVRRRLRVRPLEGQAGRVHVGPHRRDARAVRRRVATA